MENLFSSPWSSFFRALSLHTHTHNEKTAKSPLPLLCCASEPVCIPLPLRFVCNWKISFYPRGRKLVFFYSVFGLPYQIHSSLLLQHKQTLTPMFYWHYQAAAYLDLLLIRLPTGFHTIHLRLFCSAWWIVEDKKHMLNGTLDFFSSRELNNSTITFYCHTSTIDLSSRFTSAGLHTKFTMAA